jgi:hypothetical protein
VKIGFDVDGILADFSSSYRRLLKEVTGRALVTPEQALNPTTWYWEREAGYTKAEEDAVWERINRSGTFWLELGVLPGGERLRNSSVEKFHDLYFITSRSGVDCKWQTEMWLMDRCGIELPTVLISSDKGACAKALQLDVYIDDRDKNIVSVFNDSPATRLYVLDYRYNRSVSGPGVNRVASVDDMFVQERLL